MVLKILSAAMIDLAHRGQVATALLGNSEDLRDLMDWHRAGARAGEAPRLAKSWCAEICGDQLTQLLSGKTVVRVQNDPEGPRLIFEPHTSV